MFNKLFAGKPVILPAVFLAIMFIAGQADAQTKISGKLTMSYTKTDSLIVGDTEGHIMVLGESNGTNASTGETSFMDGAVALNLSYADLTMGSGPHEGYVTFKSGDDMTVVKWKGKITTTMSAEGAPQVSFSGNFEYIKGAGQYKNIKGGGTYEGHFTSNKDYVSDWQGEYTLKKAGQ